MFSTTLRKRPEWNTVPATLLAEQPAKWEEKNIETSDLMLPLPRQRQEDARQFHHFLLLSAIDVQPPAQAMARIERLFHQTGGHHISILFLLQEKNHKNGMAAYLNLQASLAPAFEINIIPLHTPGSLQGTIAKFWQQLNCPPPSRATSTPNPAVVLLPYCTLSPPIGEHQRGLITEKIGRLADLAECATTEEGREALRDLLEMGAEDVIGFWEEEFVLE